MLIICIIRQPHKVKHGEKKEPLICNDPIKKLQFETTKCPTTDDDVKKIKSKLQLQTD